MALLTKRGRELPEGSVAITEVQALRLQRTLIREWPKATDVFFLRHGPEITMATTFISGLRIMKHFTRTLNIHRKSYNFISSPVFLLPSYTSGVLCERYIRDPTLLMKLKCPLCYQLKFALSQAYLGVIFPMLFALGSCTAYATFTRCYEFGAAKTDAKLFWKEMYRLLKSGSRSYQLVGLMHSILIFTIPYMQNRELLNVMDKVKETNSDTELLEC